MASLDELIYILSGAFTGYLMSAGVTWVMITGAGMPDGWMGLLATGCILVAGAAFGALVIISSLIYVNWRVTHG